MRWYLPLLLLLLAACSDRRTFDDRYEGAFNNIEAQANAIDANLAADTAELNKQD